MTAVPASPAAELREAAVTAPIELPDRIPALTVWQPWAFALAMGWKPVENRGSRLPFKPGEVLAIHAGKTYDEGVRFPGGGYRAELEEVKAATREGRDHPALRLFRQSAVLCLVRFTGVHHSGDCAKGPDCSACAAGPWGDRVTSWCTPWSTATWFHHEVTLLHALADPVPCSGSRGKWYLPGDVEQQVRAQLARNAEPPMERPKQVADELFRRAFGRLP